MDATEARTPRRAVPSGSLEGPDDARQATLHHQVDELADGEQAYYDDLCLVETVRLACRTGPVEALLTAASLLSCSLLGFRATAQNGFAARHPNSDACKLS